MRVGVSNKLPSIRLIEIENPPSIASRPQRSSKKLAALFFQLPSMIIGFQKKFLFIHIPKCAGDSVRELLLDHANGGAQFLRKHSGYAEAEKVMGREIQRFTAFAVVRNPFDQVLSFYEHLRKPLRMTPEEIERQYPGTGGRLLPVWASELAMRLEFPDFVREIYAADPGGRRQAAWFGDLLNWLRSVDGNMAPVRILSFESLQEDFSNLAGELGLAGELPRRNASRVQAGGPGYRERYDSASRQIIETRFAPTIERFGYSF
jgi:hypothetical protein